MSKKGDQKTPEIKDVPEKCDKCKHKEFCGPRKMTLLAMAQQKVFYGTLWMLGVKKYTLAVVISECEKFEEGKCQK